ncbi:hypothetical protein DXG03_003699 [Asterophora parasitica]|uniref:Uncharacterized protein n=1 Tax=Asterophora parasitica TaxID=117018 RepID=A0A9P7KC25_9AGAR|nr:hypothetical protein DXG03_003699 [Asterophora parasitica]
MLSAPWHSAAHLQPRAILSRAISQSASRPTSATLGLFVPTRRAVFSTANETEGRTAPRDPFVFEDHTEDYTNVIQETPVRPLSTMSLIEARLPPILPKPSAGDMSIFEDPLASDYASSSVSHGYTPSSLLQTFSQLVFAKRFDEAYNFLMEIQSSGLEIPMSHLWELPAQAVTTTPSFDLETMLSRFTVWFNMVPPKHMEDLPRRFRRSRRLIFQSAHANIPVAIRFSLILASKGYATSVSPDAIPFIMRFAPPAVSARFLKDFEKADMDYQRAHSSPSAFARSRTLLVEHVRGPAVDVLARSNHLQEALSLLPRSDEPAFRLSIRTYDLLLSRLRQSKNADIAKCIPFVEALRQNTIYSTFVGPDRRLKNQSTEADITSSTDLQALEMEVNPGSEAYIGHELAAELRSLINAVQSSSTFPPTATVVAFLEKYFETGRAAAIIRLRRVALDANVSCGSLFLQAEMTYYLAQDLPILALKAFSDHFFIAGVPHDEVAAALNHFQPNRSRDNVDEHKHPAFAAIQSKSMRKLWPARAHCNLIWQALVKLTPTDEGVSKLYNSLIHFLSLNADTTSTDTSFLRSPHWPSFKVGPAVFTPFMQRLISPAHPECCPEFVRDMTRFGIVPTVHHFTQVGGFYASVDDTQRAFMVMDTLEKEHPVSTPESMLEVRKKGWRKGEAVPRPDVIFYTSMLRGFVIAKNPGGATEVVRRFKKRYVYERGQHTPMDDAMADLHRLQEDIKNQTTQWQIRGGGVA